MNLLRRFFALTPARNKRIGRFLSTVSGIITALEGSMIAYNVPIPKWLHGIFIGTAIVTAVWAGYHGQKVKK
jgi:hypothetical protein